MQLQKNAIMKGRVQNLLLDESQENIYKTLVRWHDRMIISNVTIVVHEE